MKSVFRIIGGFLFLCLGTGHLQAWDPSSDKEIKMSSEKKDITISGVMLVNKRGRWFLKLDKPQRRNLGMNQIEVWAGANYEFSETWRGCHLQMRGDLSFPEDPKQKPFFVADFFQDIKGYPPSIATGKVYPADLEFVNDIPEVTLFGVLTEKKDSVYFIPDHPIKVGGRGEIDYGLTKLQVESEPSVDTKTRKDMEDKHLKVRAVLYLNENPYRHTKVLINIKHWESKN